MTSALFTINGGTAGVAADVSASSTVNLALASTSGVRSVTWSIFGTSGSDFTAPTITKSGAPSGITASFAIPAGSGQAYGIRCVVNGGRNEVGQVDSSLTSQSAVYVLYPSGRRPFFAGETIEGDSVYGWTERINEVVAEQSGVLDHDIDMDGYSILNVGSIIGGAFSGITMDDAQFKQIYVGTGNFASSGEISLQNNKSIKMRNGANSADVTIANVNGSSVFETGTNSSQYLVKVGSDTKIDVTTTAVALKPVGGVTKLSVADTTSTFSHSGGNIVVGGGYIGIGSNTASTGDIRVANNTTIVAARNAANTADLSIALSDLSNNLAFGSNNSPGVYFDASSAHYFRIASSAVMTVSGAGVSSPAFADSTGTTSVTGLIRAKNNTTIVAARNAANSADIAILSTNASDHIRIATSSNTIAIGALSTSTTYIGGDGGGYNAAFVSGGVYLSGGAYSILNGNASLLSYASGANNATSGIYRTANNVAMVAARNAANNANLEIIGTTNANALYVGGGAAATATIKTYGWNANGLIQTIIPQASATVTNTVYHEYVFGYTTNTSGATTNTDFDLSNIEGISFASGTTAVYARVEHIAYRATSNFATYATCEQLFRYNGSTWAESGTADATTTRDAAGNAFTTPTLAMSANLLRYSHTAPATTEVVTHRIKFKVTAMKA